MSITYEPGDRVVVDSPVLQAELIVVEDFGPSVSLKEEGAPDSLCTLVMKRVVRPADEEIGEARMSLDQITKADVDVIFDLVPGAKDALQGMSEDSLQPLWSFAAESVEQERDETYSVGARRIVAKRVALAVQVLSYGEGIS